MLGWKVSQVKVAVAGGTGFIGSHLLHALKAAGHEVAVISRKPLPKASIAVYTWDQLKEDPTSMEGVDAVVNLAGESINQRWTDAAKQRILHSRLKVTQSVAEWVARVERKPSVVINGSGMSYYGNSETAVFDESSPANVTDFLSSVVRDWEAAADGIQGVRLVKLRIGLVLGADGGALPKMLLPYRMFVGGRIGSGRQWHSWIHIDDMVRAIKFALEEPSIDGPVNGTAMHPVTNDEFGRTVGRVLKRPHYFPLPASAFKLALGETSTLLLEGQRVLPRKLQDHGFQFAYPTLEEALRHLLGKV